MIEAEADPIRAVGIASAGPLHAPSGFLLDPTNFGWSSPLKVPIARELSRALKLPVRLENDAAAAALAEHWRGGAGKNCAIITLGTGLGLGVIANGQLVRGGRELHAEAGHILLQPGDRSALCGCGNYGCAEAYLSGMNFAKRASKRMGKKLSGKELAALARSGNSSAKKLFAEYSTHLAHYLHDLVVLYYPELVVLTGSFAASHALFLPSAKAQLRTLIRRRLRTLPLLPEIRISALGNQAGVLGGACIALHSDN